MALIKGPRYRSPDGEPDPKKDKSQEEPQRRGGLIKGKSMSGKFLSDSPLPSEYSGGNAQSVRRRVAGGKLLKAKWASIVQQDPDADHAPKARETAILKSTDFQPASFVSQDDGEGAQGTPRNVVMVPTSASGKKTMTTSEADDDFSVEQPPMESNVDVEAIVAEAEQKGREKAAKIIEHAQEEAKKLIDQAKIYGETAKEEARKEGLIQGKEDGYREGLAQFTAMMDEAKRLFAQMVNERRKMFEKIEPELARLSLEIAKKVIGQEIRTNHDAVISVVRQALSRMKSREQVVIKVNPKDLEHVENNRQVFAAMVEGIKDLEITADPRVGEGGCLIQTNLGSTDARLETQLEVVRLAFDRMETGEV